MGQRLLVTIKYFAKIWQTDQRWLKQTKNASHVPKMLQINQNYDDSIANLQFKNLGKNVLQDHQSQLVGPNCNQQGTNKWRNQIFKYKTNNIFGYYNFLCDFIFTDWIKKLSFKVIDTACVPWEFVLF